MIMFVQDGNEKWADYMFNNKLKSYPNYPRELLPKVANFTFGKASQMGPEVTLRKFSISRK